MNWAFSIFFGGSFLQLFSWNNRWWIVMNCWTLGPTFFSQLRGFDRSHEIPWAKCLPCPPTGCADGLSAWVNAISFSSQGVQRTWTETGRVIRNLLIRSTLISDSTVWEVTGQEVSVIHNRATLNLFNHSPQHRRSVVRPSKLSWKATQGLKPIVTQHDCWGIAISFKPWVANDQKKTTILVIEHQYMF